MSDPKSDERFREGVVVAERYVIERRLGQGGMGAVYAAHDRVLGRSVALKAIVAGETESMRRRLETEARVVASLNHPGIVTLFDVVQHDGALVLVMEHVAGKSLRDRLESGPLAPDEVTRIVTGVADALAAAHDRSLVHRDVKPDNVMVRADGRTALLDFGVVKATSTDALAPTQTRSGAVVGTPAYLAPEQINGEEVTVAADQFALAVMTFELLTAKLPWQGATAPAVMANILSAEPLRVSVERNAIPRATDDVLARALRKVPSERYASVKDFAVALGDALQRKTHDVNPLAETHVSDAGDAMPSTLTTAPRAAKSSRLRIIVALGALVGIALTGRYAISRWRSSHASSTPISDASVALTIADIPPSPTKSDSARQHFRDAMLASQHGGGGRTRDALDAAIKDDNDFASAQLQRAYDSVKRISGDPGGRAAFQRALALKKDLSSRDADFLDALTPAFEDPPHVKEMAKRFQNFTDAHPNDAQGWEAFALAQTKSGDSEHADAALDRVAALDPKAAIVPAARGRALRAKGDVAGARKMFERCVEIAGTTDVTCRGYLARSFAEAGECVDEERIGREMTAFSPDDDGGYEKRAQAAATLGEPEEAIATLLSQKRERQSEQARKESVDRDALILAERRGDFTAELAAIDRIVAVEADDDELADLAADRARILWESGAHAKSAESADAYVRLAATRAQVEWPELDVTGQLLGFMFSGARISESEWSTRRTSWVEGWTKRRGAMDVWNVEGAYVWLTAYMPGADPTRAQAVTALAAMPADAPAHYKSAFFDTRYASLLLAVDRVDEALDALKIATSLCMIDPRVHAWYLLGEARAKKNDKAGACVAFARVEHHWGHAVPRSETAEAAIAHAKTLACP